MSKKEMLINYVPGEESRIAIVEDGKLEELYQERASSESHVGNIYKGRVTNVEPSIQAAFIDFGLERNGFLHISDLHPKYFPGESKEETERVGQKTPRRDRPPIQKCLRRGQEILVQVIKEGIGTKGPTLTSYLSIPGRFLVMMLDMERHGVSRKVEDDEERRRMRQLLGELNPPEGFGFIIRTAGIGRPKTELKRDLAYLHRLWKTIDQAMQTTGGVGELYTESDLVVRTVRDVFSSDIDRIIVDDPAAAQRAFDFLCVANPRSSSQVLYYDGPIPLFHHYGIEQQIEVINRRTVSLPSGGSLVIESTEALVAIDVNSGRSRQGSDAEATAYRTNCEAVDEICRQLRLRDLGGVIVNDLIDMRDPRHRREVEQRMRNHLKRDRARTKTLPISQFGIVEMTRQRMRPSINKSSQIDCPTCHGLGQVRSAESTVLDVMRRLAVVLHHKQVAQVELTVNPEVAFQLLNRKRAQLVKLELRFDKKVLVRVRDAGLDFVQISPLDARGGTVDVEKLTEVDEPILRAVDSSTGLFGEMNEEEQLFEELQEAETQKSTAAPQSQAQPADKGQRDGEAATEEKSDGTRKRRRRRRRGGRGRNKSGSEGRDGEAADETQTSEPGADQAQATKTSDASHEAQPPSEHHDQEHEPGDVNGNLKAPESDEHAETGDGRKRRRRRRRGGRGRRKSSSGESSSDGSSADHAEASSDDHKESESSAGSNESAADQKQSSRSDNSSEPDAEVIVTGAADEDAGQPEENPSRRKRWRDRRGRGKKSQQSDQGDKNKDATDQSTSSSDKADAQPSSKSADDGDKGSDTPPKSDASDSPPNSTETA